jgi:hypothetical protein
MKFLLRFLAIYATAFVQVYLIPEYIHRRDFDRTFITWLHDRTPQNEAMLEAERRKNEIIHIGDSAVIALAFVALGSGIYYVLRLAQRKLNRQRASSGTSESPHVRSSTCLRVVDTRRAPSTHHHMKGRRVSRLDPSDLSTKKNDSL